MFGYNKNSILFCLSLFLKLLNKVSLRYLLGSFTTVSFATCWAPLVGFFSGTATCITFYTFRTALALGTHLSFTRCTLYLPTLAGSLVLSSNSRLLKAFIPFVCILLFIGHPVGCESWLYTLYWVFPLCISFFRIQSIFVRSLASTLTTHAVGSTIWIYTHPTTSHFWHALIAQVWLERLFYALILTLSYYFINHSIHQLNQFRYESRPCQDLLYSS